MSKKAISKSIFIIKKVESYHKLYTSNVNSVQFIPETIILQFCKSVVEALHYLKNTHQIIHRDIRPSNILVDPLGQIKVCDFSIAGNLQNSIAFTKDAGVQAYPQCVKWEKDPGFNHRVPHVYDTINLIFLNGWISRKMFRSIFLAIFCCLNLRGITDLSQKFNELYRVYPMIKPGSFSHFSETAPARGVAVRSSPLGHFIWHPPKVIVVA